MHTTDEQVGRLEISVDHHRPAAEQPHSCSGHGENSCKNSAHAMLHHPPACDYIEQSNTIGRALHYGAARHPPNTWQRTA